MAMEQSSADVQLSIDATMNELRDAIRKRDPKCICELTRALVWATPYAYSRPEVWSAARIDEARRLLKEAARVTVGTPKEQKCAGRPAKFMALIHSMQRARESYDEFRRAV